jgi:transposase InsO family protein
MAWKEVKVDQQRKLFIEVYLQNNFSMAALCRQFGISRPIGYKWVERYRNEGFEGLVNRSRAPLNQSQETDPSLVREILKMKFRQLDWGPKKVRGRLMIEQPNIIWPSTTTIGKIFDKYGLTVHRKYRKRFAAKTDPLSHANDSNDVWSVDFKGWWMTKDGEKCDPFTLTDNYSRFLLRCLKLEINDGDHAWAILETAFREYGLPNYIRSDNGPPFATSGVGRLSALSVKLIKAGVMPEWIEPGNPQQNGRHERMHGVLQREAVFPELNLQDQQEKLIKFQNYYNFERPHEALGQVTPGSVYRVSQRSWNGRLKPPEYPDDYKIGKVKSCGKMSWNCREIYVGRVLSGELLGLEKNEEGLFRVYFGPIFLGTITKEYELEVPRRPGRVKKHIKSV